MILNAGPAGTQAQLVTYTIDKTMDLDAASRRGLKIVKQTRKVDVSEFMPSYEGHIGAPSRKLTRVEKQLVLQFQDHQLNDSLSQLTGVTPASSPNLPPVWVPGELIPYMSGLCVGASEKGPHASIWLSSGVTGTYNSLCSMLWNFAHLDSSTMLGHLIAW